MSYKTMDGSEQSTIAPSSKKLSRLRFLWLLLLLLLLILLTLQSCASAFTDSPQSLKDFFRISQYKGSKGDVGTPGQSGEMGTAGTSGKNGAAGAPGASGSEGVAGSDGRTGMRGVPGVAGTTGPQGTAGISGTQGTPGVLAITNDTNITGSLSGTSLSLGFSGTLPVSRGGTGLSSLTTNGILSSNGTTVSSIAPGTNGQALVISGGVPSFQNLPSGFADPLTTTGDIIYRSGTGTTRLAAGSNGQFLGVQGGTVGYYNTPAGAVTSVFGRTGSVVAQSGDYDTAQITENPSNLYYTNARADSRVNTLFPSLFTTNLGSITSDNIIQGSTNKYYSPGIFNTDFASKNTDGLTEGTTNLYFTNARADSRVNTLFPSLFTANLGSITTDNIAQGTINKYYASSLFNTDLASKTTDNVAEGITNLYYTPARFDARLALKTTDAIAEGSTNLYFTNTRADGRVNTLFPGLFTTQFGAKTTDNLAEGATNLYYTSARVNTAFDTRLGTKNTDNLAEGSTNLYYTQSRFNAALSAITTDDVLEGATNLYFTDPRADARVTSLFPGLFTTNFSVKSTTDLVEGTNLYYTATRFDTAFAGKNTDGLAEGVTNLYYTNTRARAALSAGTGISYNAATGAISTAAIPNTALTNSTIALALGTTGTDVNFSASAVALGGTVTLNIPDASTTNRGLISIGTQAFAGSKIFANNLTVNGITALNNTVTINSPNDLTTALNVRAGGNSVFAVDGYGRASFSKFGLPFANLTVSTPATFNDKIIFNGNNGGQVEVGGVAMKFTFNTGETNYVGLKIASTPTTSIIYNLPTADGTNGQFLRTSGNGFMSWTTAGGITGIELDSQAKSANGGVPVGTGLILQTADANFPGLVSTNTQVFSGNKTFTGLTSFSDNITLATTKSLTLASNTSELRFNNSTGTNYVGFKSPATIATNRIWTLPAADGTIGQALTTDGAGLLSFGTPPIASTRLSGLLAANTTNIIDNLNFDQTWNWSTATTQNPLSINANALTTGTGFQVASTNTATTGNLFNVTSASTALATNGLASFNFNGAHTGSGLQVNSGTEAGSVLKINANAVTTGNALEIDANSAVVGSALLVNNSSSYNGSGLIKILSSATNGTVQNITANSLINGKALNIVNTTSTYTGGGLFSIDSSTITGTIQKINASALGSGMGLHIDAPGLATTGRLLWITSASNAAVTNGLVNFSFSGIHSGNGMQVDTITATGTAIRINAGNLTAASGQALSINVPNAANQIFVNFSKAGTTAGSITVNGANTAILYNTTSDTRLKSNQHTTAFTLADLMKIDVKDYTQSGQPSTGFIAQQLYGVYPLAVSVGGDGLDENGNLVNPWQVDYSKVTPLIIKSIQDLAKQTEALAVRTQIIETKVAALETTEQTTIVQIQSLQQQVGDLTARVALLEASPNSGNILTQASVTFAGTVVMQKSLTVGKNLTVGGSIKVSPSTAGIVTVAAPDVTTSVVFAIPYNTVPIVTAAPGSLITGQWAIQNTTLSGFDIVVSAPQTTDTIFNWIALEK